MEGNQIIVTADTVVSVRRSPLLNLPGEIRNRIYNLVFGTKSLHPVPEYVPFNPWTRGTPERNRANRGLYKLRQTCHQIATETEHYLFQTLDLSNLQSFLINARKGEKIRAHHEQLQAMLKGRWHHVRHVIIATYCMDQLVENCRRVAPEFPLPAVTCARVNEFVHYSTRIIWPADARSLTTLTIHDVHKRTAGERERLLTALGFYFPKLEDIRCSYDRENGCMRRYRISNGKLKWWYTGETFKTLPEEPTVEQWFGTLGGMSNDVTQLMSSLSMSEGM
jgi:hypothetical protein